MASKKETRQDGYPGLRLPQLHVNLNNVTDNEGRPVGELKANPFLLEAAKAVGLKFEERGSEHLRDSRDGLINISALADVQKVREEVLQDLAYIAHLYFNENVPDQITPQDFYGLASVAYAATSYLLNRPQNPLAEHGELPKHIAGLAKVALGLLTVSVLYKNTNEPISPGSVYLLANGDNQHQHLLTTDESGARRSCPATKETIAEYSSALLTENYHQSLLEELIPVAEFRRLIDYSKPFVEIASSLEALTPILVRDAFEAMRSDLDEEKDKYHELYKNHIIEFLPKFTLLVKEVNGVLGRSQEILPVTIADLEECFNLSWDSLMQMGEEIKQEMKERKTQLYFHDTIVPWR